MLSFYLSLNYFNRLRKKINRYYNINPENIKSCDVSFVLTKDVLAPEPVPLNGTTYMYAVEPGGIVIGLIFSASFNCVHIS